MNSMRASTGIVLTRLYSRTCASSVSLNSLVAVQAQRKSLLTLLLSSKIVYTCISIRKNYLRQGIFGRLSQNCNINFILLATVPFWERMIRLL